MESIKVIARINSAFPTKFGIPRQSGLVQSLKSKIIFEPEYRNPDALRGLEEFSHIWLIWGFSGDSWSPTVRPPRLGGNIRKGVFSTRSPFRPNRLGLSSVKIERIYQSADLGPVIEVLGADLMDGSSIYDIKPYIPYTDSHPKAIGGFADEAPKKLEVNIDDSLLNKMPEDIRYCLKDVLAHDPRPQYQNDPDRVYGMAFGGFDIKFRVDKNTLTVTQIE